jgi:hypothetical protein
MGADLYERLKYLKRTRSGSGPGGGPADGAVRPEGGEPLSVAPPAGWERRAAGVWHRRVFRETPEAAYLRERLEAGRAALVPPDTDAGRLVFFDAETTGLSSGAGTTAFLVGFARIGEGGIATEQLFMADYPAEPAFLERIVSMVDERDVAVSYNGKGFDSHVLRTRFLLNGMHLPLGAQVDLLYPARRLWRRHLEECSLARVEEGVLGIRRERDLPGAEVPERFFEFLRRAEPAGLEDVFAHHLQDIESLVLLLARMERIMDDPLDAAREPQAVDRFQLGRMLRAAGRAEGRQLLFAVVREDPSTREVLRAAAELARDLRRTGEVDAAAGVWREVLGRHRSVAAGIELAKYLEHRLADPRGAADLVGKLISWPHSGPFRGDLEHRLARLERRLARRPDGGRPERGRSQGDDAAARASS